MPEPPYIVDRTGFARAGTTVDPHEWQINLAPRDLSFIRVDFQLRLQFDDVEVVIEGPFNVERGGETYTLHPDDRAALGAVLAIYPSSLVANEIEPDGTLRLMFQSGDRISVPPDPHHEPWQINGPGDALVVCTPGVPAKLATWS